MPLNRMAINSHYLVVRAPSRTRTCGLLLRRQSLYPPELSGPKLPRRRPLSETATRTPPEARLSLAGIGS
jgi:hypothetical protein